MYALIPFKQDVCTFYTRCTETLQFLHAQTHCPLDTKDREFRKYEKTEVRKAPAERIRQNTACGGGGGISNFQLALALPKLQQPTPLFPL